MDYSCLIESLLEKLPELRSEYKCQDHIHGLQHCVFSIILVPYIEGLLISKDTLRLAQIGVFLEQMSTSEDIKIKEVVNVSVLEPIVLGNDDLISYFEKFLGEETLINLKYWRNRYKK